MPDTTLTPYPGQTVGPFFHFGLVYPDSHLLVSPEAPGAITLHGTVTDGNGDGVPDALVEIWQPDPDGQAPADQGHIARDGSFSGFGRAATDPDGHYEFTTLRPGSADGQAPFIAVAVYARGLLDRLFTRIYVPGDGVDNDAFIQSLDAHERASLIAVAEADGSLRFDIVLQGEKQTTFLSFDPPGTDRHG